MSVPTDSLNTTNEPPRTATVSKRIGELKEAGLLNSFTINQNVRSAMDLNLSDSEMGNLNFFSLITLMKHWKKLHNLKMVIFK